MAMPFDPALLPVIFAALILSLSSLLDRLEPRRAPDSFAACGAVRGLPAYLAACAMAAAVPLLPASRPVVAARDITGFA